MLLGGLIAFFSLLALNPAHGEVKVKNYPRIARATRQDRVLIVAPHIDDESIAAGGYAADAIASGADVYVVFLTAGDCNRISARVVNRTFGTTASSYLSVGRTRITEARVAMRMLGVPEDHYFVLGYPDRGLQTIMSNRSEIVRSRGTHRNYVPYDDALTPGSPYSFDSIMADMEQVISIAQPTTVIAPVAFDLHPDHSAAAELVDLSLSATHENPTRLGYLVHSNRIPISLVPMPARALAPPARMRRLTWAVYPLSSSVRRRKDALLASYKSQGPYASILRNAFVRTNELFFMYTDEADCKLLIARPPIVAAAARIPIAR